MNFLTYLITIAHHSHVTGDYCRNTSLLGSINDFFHRLNVVIIDYRINGKISLDAMLIAGSSNLTQIVDSKMIGRMRTHVQLTDSEINRVGSSLNGSSKGFARSYWRHYFKFVYLCIHECNFSICGCKVTPK